MPKKISQMVKGSKRPKGIPFGNNTQIKPLAVTKPAKGMKSK